MHLLDVKGEPVKLFSYRGGLAMPTEKSGEEVRKKGSAGSDKLMKRGKSPDGAPELPIRSIFQCLD